ncbi:MAG: shikimate kinase [SAR86 cluster bacterium]|jgi:shikimate kinase|nr:MAG: shikimate kinase [SAR86 cluster bacterium]URQ69469.1 AAA family ATPase [SAR86 cluster bacterium]|tara:strand:+ start:1939 stop:2427 length:489 start_codon:yes stop_codon:yes gene_type:complete
MENISLIGMAGCGKSTLGKALSKELNVEFLDTDSLIEEKHQLTLEQIKTKYGYQFLRSEEEKVIMNITSTIKIISTGGSAVYSDKSMLHLSKFSKIIYLDTPFDIIKNRIENGEDRGLAVVPGTSIEDAYKERIVLYEKWGELKLDGSLSIDELVSHTLSII